MKSFLEFIKESKLFPPTDLDSWLNPKSIATINPKGKMPSSLNGISFTRWSPPSNWNDVPGQIHLNENPLPENQKIAMGIIVVEKDGRIWVTHPANQYGGYKTTFPKGTFEPEYSYQANAIRETWEETGLKVKITGLIGDFQKITSIARFYRGIRESGTPSDMGWESEAVSLVPKNMLKDVLNMPVDHKIVDRI